MWLGSWRNMGQESLLEAELTAEVDEIKHGRITIRQNTAIGIQTCFFIGVSKESLVETAYIRLSEFEEIQG